MPSIGIAQLQPLVDSCPDLLDLDESPVKTRTVVGPVPPPRRYVWSSRLTSEAGVEDAVELFAVRCTYAASDGGDDGYMEHAVRVSDDGVSVIPVLLNCKVSYEEVPPSSLVEDTFDPLLLDASWRLSHVSLPWLVSYRAGKFALWEKRLLEPTCRAELRRMLSIGPVSSIYDHHMFPSDLEDKEKFEVVDEKTGKTVILPRPVAALRIWNVEGGQYSEVTARLDGAPDDMDAYWTSMKEKIRNTHGDEEFEALMKEATES